MFFRLIFFFIFFIYSCQPVELISHSEFNTSRLDKISIVTKNVLINSKYNPIFSDENIEDQLNTKPLEMLEEWINDNIIKFGNQNNLVINILDASIIKREIDNEDGKKYEEKTIFQYEVFFLVEYELYNDSNYLLANTTVESSRSTTSQKYISLNESEMIINDLLDKAIKEFIAETISMTKVYMGEYIK